MRTVKRYLPIFLLLLIPGLLDAQVQVRVVPVMDGRIIEQLPLSGSILSPRNSSLSTQESGLVVAIEVESGDRVAQGDVLLRLDDATTRLELERLLARRQEAQLAFDDARRLADEGRRLVEDRHIPRSEFETRLVTEAQEEARLGQLDSQVRLQRLKLEHHMLKAPYGGVIGFRHAEIGEWLDAGSPAMQLVQTDPLRVQASIPERYFGDIREGTSLTISVDAYPDWMIETRVESMIAIADMNTRSFTARVDIPNPDDRLAPGMSAQLVFKLENPLSGTAHQVPADAVIRRRDGEPVVWVIRDGKAEPIEVRIGRRNQARLEVFADGLRTGDLVVTLGNESLRLGQEVTAVQDD
jgi:RND family efflux transporter MFP subunit